MDSVWRIIPFIVLLMLKVFQTSLLLIFLNEKYILNYGKKTKQKKTQPM